MQIINKNVAIKNSNKEFNESKTYYCGVNSCK